MAVSTTARKQTFTINGVTAAFDFTFRALTSAPSDIKAIATVSGVDTTLTYTTDYTVSIDSDGIGGTLTLVSPSAVGSGTLTVYRETTNTQASDYDNYNQFPADTVETDFDIRTLVSQEQSEALDRTLQLSISTSGVSATLPAPEADKYLAWNTDADALENKTFVASDTVVVTSQANAEAGTNNTEFMTPLRTRQAQKAYNLVLDAAVNYAKGADIASAATMNIGAATGNFVDITGTVTTTALGTVQAGTTRKLRFITAGQVLTHNATSLILPGSANITTGANDTAEFVSLGSGNWMCFNYKRSSGIQNIEGPCFSASMSADMTNVGTGTSTRITYDTEAYDTNSNYDVSEYRFTPTVAGKYLLLFSLRINIIADAKQVNAIIKKNGSGSGITQKTVYTAGTTDYLIIDHAYIVNANGSSDYYEVWVEHQQGANTTFARYAGFSQFQGFYLRS